MLKHICAVELLFRNFGIISVCYKTRKRETGFVPEISGNSIPKMEQNELRCGA